MKTLLSGELRVKVKAGTVVKFCDAKGVTVTPVMELTAAILMVWAESGARFELNVTLKLFPSQLLTVTAEFETDTASAMMALLASLRAKFGVTVNAGLQR